MSVENRAKAKVLDEYEESLKERTSTTYIKTLLRELCLRLRAIEWELEDQRRRETLETLK